VTHGNHLSGSTRADQISLFALDPITMSPAGGPGYQQWR
jgi:hypothetical protein